MNRLSPLLIFCFLLFSCGNGNNKKLSAYPKYKTVLAHLDDVKLMQDTKLYYDLAKKPEGWFLEKIDLATAKPIAETQVWSSATKNYSRISESFLRTPDPTGQHFDLSQNSGYDEYKFDHNAYFGYEGWEDDAIKILESTEKNDTLYEELARAYSAKISSLGVEKHEGKVDDHVTYTDAEAKTFCELADKAIAAYKKLLEINSDYETLVGKVKTKLSNEYIYYWSQLKQKGREKEAQQYLVGGLYDEEFIHYAKNMLMSAEKNGIIFTDGDNDTYPLWYVQAQMNYRTDVAVVNTSLLNVYNWIFYWQKKYHLTLTLPAAFYADASSEATKVASPGFSTTMNMSALAGGLQTKSTDFYSASSKAYVIPAGSLKMTIGKESEGVEIPLSRGQVFRGELVMMDILSSNFQSRPVYFPVTASNYGIEGELMKNFGDEGMLKIWKDCPVTDPIGMINPEAFYLQKAKENVMKYDFGIKDMTKFESGQIAANYVFMMNGIATSFLENNDTASAREIAMKAYTMLPIDKMDEPAAGYVLGQALSMMHQDNEAKKMFSSSIGKCKAGAEKSEDGDELRRINMILEYTKNACEKAGYASLEQEAKNAAEQVKKKADNFPAKELRY
jgi:hypothetical protein